MKTTCPHCHSGYTAPDRYINQIIKCPNCAKEHTLAKHTSITRKTKSSKLNAVIWSLIAISLISAVSFFTLFNKEKEDTKPTNEELVMFNTEREIKKVLFTPSVAKFDLYCKKEGNYYLVLGHVDSQNKFGAMLRSDVTFIYEDPDTVFPIYTKLGKDSSGYYPDDLDPLYE